MGNFHNIQEFLEGGGQVGDGLAALGTPAYLAWHSRSQLAASALADDARSQKIAVGDIIKVARYFTDGPAADMTFICVSADPTSDPSKITLSGGRWLKQIFPTGEADLKCFGAYADGSLVPARDDSTAVGNAFTYARNLAAALYAGTPDAHMPRGITLKVSGYVKHSNSLPLFSGLKLKGPANATIFQQSVLYYTGTGNQFNFNEVLGGPGITNNEAFGVELSGVMFRGLDTCVSNCMQPWTELATAALKFSTVEKCEFLYFKPLNIQITGSRFDNNNFDKTPFGAVVFHGSDWIATRNYMNAQPVAGVVVPNPQHVFVADFSGAFNARFNQNYLTGATSAQKPMTCRVGNSGDCDFTENWYDLCDGPGLVIQDSYGIRATGGRFSAVGLAPMATDAVGTPVSNRYDCCILFLGTTKDCEVGASRFQNIPANIQTVNWADGAHTGSFVVRRNFFYGAGQLSELLRTQTMAANALIHAEDFGSKVNLFSGSGTTAALRVVGATYKHNPADAGAGILVVPQALAGRKFTVIAGHATQLCGVNFNATDTIRGQAGMTKVRMASDQRGKSFTCTCTEAGVWDVSTDGAVTYAP